MTGRPSKLTGELQTQICNLLLQGNFVATVCDHVGIHKATFYRWVARGERAWEIDQKGGYVDFCDAIKKGAAMAEVDAVTDIRQGVDNWQARAWWLERRYPDRWSNRKRGARSGRRHCSLLG